MPTCPKCQSAHAVTRSHRRPLERVLSTLINFYPYRCEGCNIRFRRFLKPVRAAQSSQPTT